MHFSRDLDLISNYTFKEWNTLAAEEMDYAVEPMSIVKHSLTVPSAVEVIPQLDGLQLCIDIPSTVDPFVDAVGNVRIDHAFVDMICRLPRLSTKILAQERGIPLTRRPFVIGDCELDRLREMRRDGHSIMSCYSYTWEPFTYRYDSAARLKDG